MSMPAPAQIRDLLLHRLPEEQAQRLEEQLMQDPDVADLLRHEETDLVDDYVLDRLAAGEREAFEQHLLIDPVIRERVEIARALHDLAVQGAAEGGRGSGMPAKVRPWNRWPIRAAAAVFLGCVFAVVLVTRVNRQAEVHEPALTGQGPDDALQSGPADTAESPASIVLLADIQRGGEPQVMEVRPGAGQVRLQAEVASNDSSVPYRLSIADETGRAIFSASDLAPRESGGYVFVEVMIPAGGLGTGRRTVTLEPQRPDIESSIWQLDVQAAN